MNNARILIVDDEPLNVEIIVGALGDAGYQCVTACDGVEGWEILQKTPTPFDAILLDRMMPRMGGMELLELIKTHATLAVAPVILQTARASPDDIRDGIQAGAFYYLCKPYDDETLLAVVKSAIDDQRRYRDVLTEAVRTTRTALLLEEGEFAFRTPNEARDLAALLSSVSPDGERASIGLVELMLNAIEHGNLGISYDDKSHLVQTGTWEQEVLRRLELPENRGKRAKVSFKRDGELLHFTIRDCGPGFDWKRYLEIDESRAFDNHGRGIAIAKYVAFDEVHFNYMGNEVSAAMRTTATGAALKQTAEG